MPSQSREAQVNPATTPYYHCMSRCVRRAFLMGDDAASGKNFDHRKAWVEQELGRVCSTFAVDCCAYAVMSNHLHTVLRVDVERAAAWTDAEVDERAEALWPMAVQRWQQVGMWEKRREEYRTRLGSLSWFMRVLNERIARRANREDGVKGRFWEGRFKSRPILDEGALLTCMAYVDLNPVRAGLADSLSGSEFTSIAARLAEVGERLAGGVHGKQRGEVEAHGGVRSRKSREVSERRLVAPTQKRASSTDVSTDIASDDAASANAAAAPAVPLMPCAREDLVAGHAGHADRADDADDVTRLPMTLDAYVDLVRFTGQALRSDGKGTGTLPADLGELLRGVGLNEAQWLRTIREFPEERFSALGECHLIRERARSAGNQHAHGVRWARRAYLAA